MPKRHDDNKAQPDELGKDPGQIDPESGGRSGDSQQLSHVEDTSEESVEELSDTGQAVEAGQVEGSEDAADHPERPVHTHNEYRRPEDVPPQRESGKDAA
jgi:hypothetical protein